MSAFNIFGFLNLTTHKKGLDEEDVIQVTDEGHVVSSGNDNIIENKAQMEIETEVSGAGDDNAETEPEHETRPEHENKRASRVTFKNPSEKNSHVTKSKPSQCVPLESLAENSIEHLHFFEGSRNLLTEPPTCNSSQNPCEAERLVTQDGTVVSMDNDNVVENEDKTEIKTEASGAHDDNAEPEAENGTEPVHTTERERGTKRQHETEPVHSIEHERRTKRPHGTERASLVTFKNVLETTSLRSISQHRESVPLGSQAGNSLECFPVLVRSTRSNSHNPPETEQLVQEMNQTFKEIEKIRKGCLEEDYAVPELREDLKQFKRLRSQFVRASKNVSSSLSARRDMERIYQQMVALCGDIPELREPMKAFKKRYATCMKQCKGTK